MKTVARFAGVAIFALALTLSGCSGEQAVEETTTPPAPEPTTTLTPPEPEPTETTEAPEPTPEPAAEIALPSDCSEIFDADFIDEIADHGLPLNDPGLTMPSTVMLETGSTIISTEPSLRCTWGYPSEVGIATTVALITEAQHRDIIAEAEDRGFTCDVYPADETRCIYENDEEDSEFGAFAEGEEHSLRGNAWVATHWMNIEIPNYTDRIVAELWG